MEKQQIATIGSFCIVTELGEDGVQIVPIAYLP